MTLTPVSRKPPVPTVNKIPDTVPDPATTTSLSVDLAGRAYDIDIGAGLLATLGTTLTAQFGNRLFVPVVDAVVAEHHLMTVVNSFSHTDASLAEPIIIASGEGSKSWDGLQTVVEGLLDRGVDRRAVVIAIGGGVVGDLAGFAAASVMRGVDFVQVPTTLLAQVDSSVGGKTGINTRHGKNLVGAFHQPRRVVIDIDTLATLPAREMCAGYAEVVKYGLLGDAGFFHWLLDNGRKVLDRDPAALVEAIRRSCAAKAAIVAADEREAGQRALLNLGHTFAHAFEAEGGYNGTLLHGEAVSIGMALAFRLSAALGYCSDDDVIAVEQHLYDHDMPLLPREGAWRQRLSTDRLLGHMAHDKKTVDGQLTFILARGIGDAFITRDVPTDAVRGVLDDFLIRLATANA